MRSVSTDRQRLYIEYRSGLIASAEADEPTDMVAGTVVLVDPKTGALTPCPGDLWPEESWVGVVRLRLPDVTVVDSGGRWRLVTTRDDITYGAGNTVEATDSLGVLRVLCNEPLRLIELPELDDRIADRFKIHQKDSKETFADFGGLQSVIDRARELVELPLRHRQSLYDIGARPIKGVLFTGQPGTGKTMLARIIANLLSAE